MRKRYTLKELTTLMEQTAYLLKHGYRVSVGELLNLASLIIAEAENANKNN